VDLPFTAAWSRLKKPVIEGTPPLTGLVVLIPAYRPDRTLVDLVATLSAIPFPDIVIVDDGSGPDCAPFFEALAQIGGVRILNHAANQGKGAALKTGIAYILRSFPHLTGIVTADADGQHLPEDILRVAEKLQSHPAALILGARAFSGKVPFRSRIGNTLIRKAVKLLVGAELHDTQTGLRGIPAGFAPQLLPLTPTGYDFELDMLIAARKDAIEIIEQPIHTVYEPGNKSSHFNPFLDSLKVGLVLLRFSYISLLSAVIDNTLFYLIWHHGRNILLAQIVSRTTASLFNYFLVRKTVFHARGRDTGSFPKYISLVAGGGTLSYACIRLITATTRSPVFRTKIIVETLLFFVNFTVQRDWVFLRRKDDGTAAEPVSFARKGLLWSLLLIPAAIVIFGLGEAHLLDLSIWTPTGELRFAWYFEFCVVVSLVFGLAARRYFVSAVAAAVILCSVYAVGFVPVGAVLLFVFSTTVLGRLVFGDSIEASLTFLAGSALWIVAMYLTMQLPVHYEGTHLAALILPLVAWRTSRTLAAECIAIFRPATPAPGLAEFGASAGLAFVLLANWLIVLKPDVSTDGLAMHLAVPVNIAAHHAFTIDFHRFIWALMPMGGDLLYSLVYPVGGEYAARLLNFAMLVCIAALLVRTARQFVSKPLAIFMAMLFASTPVVYLTTGNLFVENFVAAMAIGALAGLWRFHDTRASRYLFLTSLLFGALMGLKVGGIATALLGLAALLFTALGQKRIRLSLVAAAVAVLLLVGSVPYVKAWCLSGNPFFPFETGPFKSTLVAKDIRDHEYDHPLSWKTPYDLTFHSSGYYEGQNGSAGFQYLLFLPLIAGCFIGRRGFKARTAILLGVGTAVIVVATQPNVRYLYFIFPLLTVGVAASISWLSGNLFRAAVALAVAVCFLNIWFLPTADWYHRDFYSSPLFSDEGRKAYLLEHDTGAERIVISYLNRNHPSEPVVLTDDSSIATIQAPVWSNTWHDYVFLKQVRELSTPLDIYRLFRQRGIRQMIVDRSHATRQMALTNLINICGQPEFHSLVFTALRLRPDCERALLEDPTAARKFSLPAFPAPQ
jgi:glycosyltransferase involved in cell wall biosynthesis